MAVKLSAAQVRVFEEVRSGRVLRARDGWSIGDQRASGADVRVLGRAEADGLLQMRSRPSELQDGELMKVELTAAARWALRLAAGDAPKDPEPKDQRSERDRALDTLAHATATRVEAIAAEDEALLIAAEVRPKITLREMAGALHGTEEGVRKRIARLRAALDADE